MNHTLITVLSIISVLFASTPVFSSDSLVEASESVIQRLEVAKQRLNKVRQNYQNQISGLERSVLEAMAESDEASIDIAIAVLGASFLGAWGFYSIGGSLIVGSSLPVGQALAGSGALATVMFFPTVVGLGSLGNIEMPYAKSLSGIPAQDWDEFIHAATHVSMDALGVLAQIMKTRTEYLDDFDKMSTLEFALRGFLGARYGLATTMLALDKMELSWYQSAVNYFNRNEKFMNRAIDALKYTSEAVK